MNKQEKNKDIAIVVGNKDGTRGPSSPLRPSPQVSNQLSFDVPPVEDDAWMPNTSEELGKASYFLCKTVPDESANKIYLKIKKLVMDENSVAENNYSGEFNPNFKATYESTYRGNKKMKVLVTQRQLNEMIRKISREINKLHEAQKESSYSYGRDNPLEDMPQYQPYVDPKLPKKPDPIDIQRYKDVESRIKYLQEPEGEFLSPMAAGENTEGIEYGSIRNWEKLLLKAGGIKGKTFTHQGLQAELEKLYEKFGKRLALTLMLPKLITDSVFFTEFMEIFTQKTAIVQILKTLKTKLLDTNLKPQEKALQIDISLLSDKEQESFVKYAAECYAEVLAEKSEEVQKLKLSEDEDYEAFLKYFVQDAGRQVYKAFGKDFPTRPLVVDVFGKKTLVSLQEELEDIELEGLETEESEEKVVSAPKPSVFLRKR